MSKMVASEDIWILFPEFSFPLIRDGTAVALHSSEDNGWRNVQFVCIDELGYTALNVGNVVEVDDSGKFGVFISSVI